MVITGNRFLLVVVFIYAIFNLYNAFSLFIGIKFEVSAAYAIFLFKFLMGLIVASYFGMSTVNPHRKVKHELHDWFLGSTIVCALLGAIFEGIYFLSFKAVLWGLWESLFVIAAANIGKIVGFIFSSSHKHLRIEYVAVGVLCTSSSVVVMISKTFANQPNILSPFIMQMDKFIGGQPGVIGALVSGGMMVGVMAAMVILNITPTFGIDPIAMDEYFKKNKKGPYR